MATKAKLGLVLPVAILTGFIVGTTVDSVFAGYKTNYSRYYNAGKSRLGADAVGRNIRRYGLSNGKEPSKQDYLDSTATIKNMLHPPKLKPVQTLASHTTQGVSSSSQVTQIAQSTSSSSSGGSCAGGPTPIPCSIIQCESGGSYTARNPSSGAYGRYQILPSTSAAYGCDMSTPGGQDACASKVWEGQGRGAWVC